MEEKSAFETRNKRKLQSDAESHRRRHKGGMQINNHHKNDADIRMETIIYKLDSSNKIVLPMAHETNTDRDFLKYVQTYLEQTSLTDNHVERCNILDKPKVKHERAHNSKRLSYDSDATIEEQVKPKTARHRRSCGRNTLTNKDVAADDNALTYIYEKRPSDGVSRNSTICSCQPRLQHNIDGSFIVPNEAAFSRVASVARDNGQHVCELSEEQMLRCFQLVFKQLCTLNNVDGTVLNVDVATPMENPLQSVNKQQNHIQNPTSYGDNTVRLSYTSSPPAIYNQPLPQEIAPLPATIENYAVPEATPEAPEESAYLQYIPQPPPVSQPRQQSQTESLTQSNTNKKMAQEQFFYPSHPKSDFTEPVETQVLGKQFDINNEPLPLPLPNRSRIDEDLTKRHSLRAAQQTTEMQQQHNQQHNNQQALPGQMNQHYYAGQLPGQQQQHSQQQQQPPQQQQQLLLQQQQQQQQLQLQQQRQQQQQQQQQQQLQLQQQRQQQLLQQQPQQQQQQYQKRHSSFRNSEARESTFMENYPTEFDREHMLPLHRLSTARPSTVTPTTAELEEGLGMNQRGSLAISANPNIKQQQGAGGQSNTNYPIYPFGQRDGLQNVTADNVQIIPNIRVVDYNENDCGMPTCTPGGNESYEYILMRVKKKTTQCPCD